MSALDVLVEALISIESNHNINAVGPMTKYGTAKGLGQLLDSTGAEMHAKLGLPGNYAPFNPWKNRTITTAYLQGLLTKFGDDALALAAYNWGQGNLQKLITKIGTNSFIILEPHLPKETRDYVKKVIGKRKEYLL